MEKISNTAVFTVIFPANEKYLEDYTISLKSQTDQDFDLVVMNDGVENVPGSIHEFNSLIYNGANSIARTRELGITRLIELGYSKIIFSDSDDQLKTNRVAVLKRLLDDYDFVANDLDLINAEGELLSKNFWKERLDDLTLITPNFLKDKNVFGLGNSAITGAKLRPLKFPNDLMVIDWYMFLKLITEESRAIFTSQTSTRYRQHAANIGAAGKITKKTLRRALEVKDIYYKLLSSERSDFIARYNRIQLLKEKWKDENKFTNYLDDISQKISNPFWWEEVQ